MKRPGIDALPPAAQQLLAAAETLSGDGQFAAAAARLRDATIIAGDRALPWQRLGSALAQASRPGEAVVALLRGAACGDGGPALAAQLGDLLRSFVVTDPVALDPAGLLACFAMPGVDYQPFVKQSVLVLKSRWLQDALALGRQGDWTAAAAILMSPSGRGFRDAALARALLRQAVNTDVELEFLLSAVRTHLLAAPADKRGLDFVLDLAWQCSNNGWVWFETAAESAALARLEAATPAALAGSAALGFAAEWQLAILALYRPLHRLAALAALRRGQRGRYSARFGEFLQANVWPRLEEARLKGTVATFTAIRDPVSRAVQELYEEDPYPRWLSLTESSPEQEARRLALHFAPAELAAFDAGPRVLIAGCGTGRHAIEAAFRYGAAAEITAVDLSAASLAYAMRMARHHGTANIRFLQGDLLAIDRLGGDFDIIESVGVLHHLAEPLAGWRALTKCLRSGGLMKIGLYSAAARAPIAAARAAIAERDLAATPEGIRAFRRELLAGKDAAAPWRERVLQAWDFFNLGECRDLLFHVQEQNFTIPEIGAALTALGLEFRGFTVAPAMLAAFQQRFPGASATDLAAWQRFEAAHPDAFVGMYRFWCFKP